MTDRETLPNRRLLASEEFEHGGLVYVAGVGRFADGRPAEVFLDCVRNWQGKNMITSDMAAVARDAAVLLSIALQHGSPVAVLRGAVTRLDDGSPATVVGAVLDRLCAEEG